MSFLSANKKHLAAELLKKRGISSAIGQTDSDGPKKTKDNFGPLSLPQEGLWFLEQLHPGGQAHSIPCTIRIQGNLDVHALRMAVDKIVSRHDALRTTFSENPEGIPVQTVHKELKDYWSDIDCSDSPTDTRDAEVVGHVIQAATRPFDLQIGPLFRTVLIKVTAEDHVFCVNFHHIVADGWSVGIFSRELDVLYRAASGGEEGRLPKSEFTYLDFAKWQRQRLNESEFSEQLAFWKKELADTETSAEVNTPNDNSDTAFLGSHESFDLGSDATKACRKMSRENGVTPYVALLSAFYCIQENALSSGALTIGSTFANRSNAQFEGTVGHFVNTLPIVAVLSEQMTFGQLMKNVQHTLLNVQKNQDISLGTIVKQLNINRRVGTNPLFEVVFDFLTPHENPAQFGYGMSFQASGEYRLGDLRAEPMDIEAGIARFDLAVFLWDLGNTMQGVVEYKMERLDQSEIRELISRFKFAVSFCATNTEVPLENVISAIEVDAVRRAAALANASKAAIRERLKRVSLRSTQGRQCTESERRISK